MVPLPSSPIPSLSCFSLLSSLHVATIYDMVLTEGRGLLPPLRGEVKPRGHPVLRPWPVPGGGGGGRGGVPASTYGLG